MENFMLAPADIQKFSAMMPILYTPQSIEDFPNHVLSILGKLMDLEESGNNCIDFLDCQATSSAAKISHSLTKHKLQSSKNIEEEKEDLAAEASNMGELPRQQTENRLLSQLKNEIPIFSRYFQAHEGCASKISDFAIESNFHRVEGVYWRFFKPIGSEDRMDKTFIDPLHPATTHAIYSLKADVICLTISRSHQAFTQRDRALLDLIRPHLMQAYHNAVKFTESQQQLTQRDLVLNQFGTILLSADGRVQLMTERAWQLLEVYFAPCSPDRLPDSLQQWSKEQISKLKDNSQTSGSISPLYLDRSGQQLRVDLIPYPAAEKYLLKLKEYQSPFSIEALQTIGLTKREAEVLCSIAKDKGNAEIAKLLNCSLGTVKKHLEHIYEKLEVQTRTAAVMKALQSIGVISS
jgi:DNA-binding CsgD family transcriptional regulator